MPRKSVDLTGRVCGQLTIVRRSRKNNARAWLCKCTCGEKTTVPTNSLTSGNTKSCGCLRKTRGREVSTTHGHSTGGTGSGSPEYITWMSMRERCHNSKQKNYVNYGGRGITVCERWDRFESFLADMGPCSPGMSIDRIDNSGNYEPSNCRWADRKTQCRNRRSNRLLTIGDTTASIAEWSEKVGIKPGTLSYRICHGWTPEEAIRTPLQKNLSFNDRSNADPEIANL